MLAIACMAQNYVIGLAGKIPWHIRDDLAFFKEQTLNKKIVVGRVTFEKLPYLKNREIYVLGSQPGKNYRYKEEEVTFLNNINDVPEDAVVTGGAKVYEALLPRCDELLLTIIHKDYTGDAYFPQYDHLFHKPKNIFSKLDAREDVNFSIWRLESINK